MIRLKKSPFTKKIKLIFEKRPPYFSKELLLALLVALSFHGLMTLLFSIETKTIKEKKALPRAKVALNFSQKPLNIAFKEQAEDSIAPPPGYKIPFTLRLSNDPDDYIKLDPKQKSQSKAIAFIKGPFPKEIEAPQLKSRQKEDHLKLSFRSDTTGEIFWYDWIEKPLDKDILAPVEDWVKTLRLRSESAFSPQVLEVFFSYD